MTIEKTYDSPASDVWKAITQPELLRRWYFDIPDFKAEVGFAFSFEGGGPCEKPNTVVGEVTEVVPGRRLSYSWRWEGHAGDSLVIFELFDLGDSTRLRLTHEGLETFQAEFLERKNVRDGWRYLIDTALHDFLQKQTI